MKKVFLSAAICIAAVLSALNCSAQAKYVFFFIGDGMGMGHVNAAEAYLCETVSPAERLLMTTFPVTSQLRTFSANTPVTDSAAAGTALSTGSKTNNGMIGMNADTIAVSSIANDFMKAGYAVGIATTVAGDDATPAAFYAHVPSRRMSIEIGSFAPESGISYFAAPVYKHFKNAGDNGSAWLKEMKSKGYVVVNNYSEYAALKKTPEKLLMLSDKAHNEQAGYTIDSIPGVMTAEQITRTGIKQLSAASDKGFFLMVESGNIDWAAHANDGAAVIKEILNYQKAIDVAYQFYLAHPDETLIVITADHDTGGMALGRDGSYFPNVSLIDFQKISKDRFSDYCKELLVSGKKLKWADMKKFLKKNLSLWDKIQLNDKQTQRLRDSFEQALVQKNAVDQETLYNSFNRFATDVYDVLNAKYGIGWTSTGHTSNFVPIYAIGEGAYLFTNNLNNTDVPMLILRSAGISRR